MKVELQPTMNLRSGKEVGDGKFALTGGWDLECCFRHSEAKRAPATPVSGLL